MTFLFWPSNIFHPLLFQIEQRFVVGGFCPPSCRPHNMQKGLSRRPIRWRCFPRQLCWTVSLKTATDVFLGQSGAWTISFFPCLPLVFCSISTFCSLLKNCLIYIITFKHNFKFLFYQSKGNFFLRSHPNIKNQYHPVIIGACAASTIPQPLLPPPSRHLPLCVTLQICNYIWWTMNTSTDHKFLPHRGSKISRKTSKNSTLHYVTISSWKLLYCNILNSKNRITRLFWKWNMTMNRISKL